MPNPKRRSHLLKRKLTRWYRFVGFSLIFLIGILDIKLDGKISFWSFLQAAGVLSLIVLLVRSPGQSLRLLWEWVLSHLKKTEVMPRKVRLSSSNWVFMQGGIAFLSICFLLSWLVAWIKSTGFGEEHFEVFVRFRTFLHAGLFMSFIAVALSSRRLKLIIRFLDLTPGRMVFFLYGVTALVGTFILIMPFSLLPEASVKLIDALFLAFSALTVTGLAPVNVANTFSIFGQTILLVMIQIGGLGIVAISYGLVTLTRKKMSLAQTLMGQELYDIPHVGKMGQFIQNVVFFTIITEAIGAIFLYFFLPSEIDHRFFHAIFHSVSAFCNAGFSSFEDNLALPGFFAAKSVVAIFIVIGGIGFPVLFELLSFAKPTRKLKTLSSGSFLVLLTSAALIVFGALGIGLIESTVLDPSLGLVDRIGNAFFYSVSARTAGFNVSDLNALTFGSQLLIAFLMTIGGSPLSTAGGIKTTTFGIILASAYSLMRGHKWVQFGRSEISTLILQKCITVVFLYFTTLLIAIFFLATIEPISPWALTFEAISALSTVGFSLGVTENISSFSKLIIIGLMIAGRLGLVTIVYIGIGRVTPQKFRYPQEHYYVG